VFHILVQDYLLLSVNDVNSMEQRDIRITVGVNDMHVLYK